LSHSGKSRALNLGWRRGGLAIVMIVSLIYGRPGDPTSTFGTTIRFDWLGFLFKMLFLLGPPSRRCCSWTTSRSGSAVRPTC
jgi:hypothetical protein